MNRRSGWRCTMEMGHERSHLQPERIGFFYTAANLLLKWEYTANGGADGSKGMTVSFDGTDRPSFAQGSFNAFQPTASDASPLDKARREARQNSCSYCRRGPMASRFHRHIDARKSSRSYKADGKQARKLLSRQMWGG